MEDNSQISADPYQVPPSIRAASRDAKKRGGSKTFGVDRHSAIVAPSTQIGLKDTLAGGPIDGAMMKSNEVIPRK